MTRRFFGWLTYTIYEYSRPVKVGITFKPTVGLEYGELNQLIDELTIIRDEMKEKINV